jgi:hypothetical protein
VVEDLKKEKRKKVERYKKGKRKGEVVENKESERANDSLNSSDWETGS